MNDVAVVIPVYNEAKYLYNVIKEIKAFPFVKNVIVVDDFSNDMTTSIAADAGADFTYRNNGNYGVGYSTRFGIQQALLCEGVDAIVTLDGDGQHDPSDMPGFIAALDNGYDIAIGRRCLRSYPRIKRFGNWFLRGVANLKFPSGIKDTECGYRAFTADVARKLDLKADDYAVCMDFVFNTWKNKWKVANVPIESVYRYGKGTKIGNGIRNMLFLMKRNFFRER